jgi:hypothetical protein
MYNNDRRMFVNGSKRLIIVFGPPLLLFIGFRWMVRRRERMTPAQIAEAQRLAREWKPKQE